RLVDGSGCCRRSPALVARANSSPRRRTDAGIARDFRHLRGAESMIQPKTEGRRISVEEFERLFASLKNWGRWGPNDERGTLNYVAADKVRAAAALVRRGRSVSLS